MLTSMNASERTTVSSEDAPLSHSTSLTSLEDSTAEDAVHALIAPARYRAHKSQQIEDSERTRASTPREGMDWFDRFGGNRVVPAHLPNATYPVNYEGHATNWSMVHHLMFTQMFEHPTFTFSPKRAQQSKKPLPPIPKHVLDIGCDIMASFIVEMLQFPGWENTHFTGLDLAPVLFPQGKVFPLTFSMKKHRLTSSSPDRLPAEMKQRVRFVQADIFKRWPFEDATFDFVRMANLEHVVPEDVWQHALEEARRVAGGGLIEVSAGSMASESQINALSRTGDSPGIMEEVRMRDEAHLTAAMKAAHDRAGLTIWPLSMIPFNLIMTSKMVDKTGEISMSTNWHLRDDDDVESFHDSVKSISSANSSGQKWAAALDEQACRSALAAHTGIHCGLIERQYEDWKYYNPRSNISWKDHVGIFDAFHMQRTRQAGLGRMIGTAWNWRRVPIHFKRGTL